MTTDKQLINEITDYIDKIEITQSIAVDILNNLEIKNDKMLTQAPLKKRKQTHTLNSDIYIDILRYFTGYGTYNIYNAIAEALYSKLIRCSKVIYEQLTTSEYILNEIIFIVVSDSHFKFYKYLKNVILILPNYSTMNRFKCENSLTYLEIRDFKASFGFDALYFPKQLHTLLLQGKDMIHRDFFGKLKNIKDLRHLTISEMIIKGNTDFTEIGDKYKDMNIINNIESLEVVNCIIDDFDYIFNRLPKKLKKLRILNTIKTFSQLNFINNLPDSIEDLEIVKDGFHTITPSNIDIRKFPKSLKKFSFRCSSLDDASLLNYLPDDLNSLILDSILHLNVFKYPQRLKELNLIDIDINNYNINLIPSNIEKLSISHIDITDGLFINLLKRLKKLKYLYIKLCTKLDGSYSNVIPQTLEELYIIDGKQYFAQETTFVFPAKLKKLSIDTPRNTIIPFYLNNFPETIEYLSVDAKRYKTSVQGETYEDYTDNGFLLLYKNLKYINLNSYNEQIQEYKPEAKTWFEKRSDGSFYMV